MSTPSLASVSPKATCISTCCVWSATPSSKSGMSLELLRDALQLNHKGWEFKMSQLIFALA